MPATGIGALIGLGLGAFGKKPKAPELEKIDPNAVQAQTVAGNQANFADIAKLAAGVNTFSQDQLNSLIDKTLGVGVREQIQSNLASQLKGEIPQDVQNAIFRGVAARSAATNAFGGGGFTRNVTARDLGLTSLDITNKALSSAESWLASAKAPTFDVTSMFFTPQQRLAFSQQQQGLQYQNDLLKAGLKAAPDPGMAALAQGIDSDLARTENAALSFAGMGAGGGFNAVPSGGLGSGGTSMFTGGGGLGGAASTPYNLGGYNFGGSGS